jgi:hypothetical protein
MNKNWIVGLNLSYGAYYNFYLISINTYKFALRALDYSRLLYNPSTNGNLRLLAL